MFTSEDNSTEKEFNYTRVWIYFWILGTINNFAYVVILAGADSLARSFDASSLIGVIAWANVGFGTFVKMLNATEFCESYAHATRLYFATVLMLLGLIIVACSTMINFYVCIVGITVIGCFSALGESVFLGFLKMFPPSITGSWSSGTGMAGVGGTLFYLGFRSIMQQWQTTDRQINEYCFFILIPQALIYGVFVKILNGYVRSDGTRIPEVAVDQDQPLLQEDPTASVSELAKSRASSLEHKKNDDAEISLMSQPYENNNNALKGFAVYLHCLKLVFSRSFQLASVYFFEYVILVGFAAQANESCKYRSCSWFENNMYEILSFFYQVGVLLSRSSVGIFRVKKIEILTFLQAVNFAAWFIHVCQPFMPMWLQCLWIVYVGLLGGAMYVNTFYDLMSDKEIPDVYREKCLNITSIFVMFGIVASSGFEIGLAQAKSIFYFQKLD